MPRTATPLDLSLILRGVFASLVVFWHTYGSEHAAAIPGWLNVPGRVSVWFFFGLSGYVIGRGLLSGRYTMKDYATRRAARVLPLFWLLTLVALVLAAFNGSELPVTLGNAFASLTALQWTHSTYFVGVFWTLGIEMQFYVAAPLITAVMLWAGRLGPALAGALWVAIWLLTGSFGDDRTLLGNLPHFLVGLAVAQISLQTSLSQISTAKVVSCAVAGAVFLAIASSSYREGGFWGGMGIVWTDAAILLLLCAHVGSEGRRLNNLLANTAIRFLSGLGVLAYGIYAWHGLLLTFVPWLNQQFFITFAVSLGLAHFSFVYFERPIMRWARTSSGCPPASQNR